MEGFEDLLIVNYQEIQDAVNKIAYSDSVTRLDFKYGNISVLVYRAGTVIRVDMKAM